MKNATWMSMLGVAAFLMPWSAMRAQTDPGIRTESGKAQLVPADQRATDAEVDKLFEVMRIRQQMAATATMMPQMMKQQFDQQAKEMEKDHPEWASLSEEQRQAMSKIMEKYMSQAMTLYNTDEMLADMRGLYEKHLSRSDVDGTIAFYSSPAGQHFLDMVPTIMQEFVPNLMTKMQAKMRPLIVEMSKEMAEAMQAAGGKK